MPYLVKPKAHYENFQGKKYDAVLSRILSLYTKALEDSVYPHDKVYPKRSLP